MNKFEPFLIHTCEGRHGENRRDLEYRPHSDRLFAPFEIYDPFGLRNAVVPVFCQKKDGHLFGVGTAFHVDGFGNFLTAYHVIDFVENHLSGRPVLLLSIGAVVFGTTHIPADCFVSPDGVFASMIEADDPIATLQRKSLQRPAIDVASLKVARAGPGARSPQTLPIRTNGWLPQIGETVLAIGFPQLDLSEINQTQQSALLREGMYGAYGRIVHVHEQGTSRSNPTPVFEVESDWPSGMSGGPVLNRSGEVVGLVSRSIRAEPGHSGTGYAVHFGLARDIELLTPNVDRINPGWRICWGVFLSPTNQLINTCSTKEEAEVSASKLDSQCYTRRISHRIGTLDFMEFFD